MEHSWFDELERTQRLPVAGVILAKFNLKEYARTGAEQRVKELTAELAAIYRVFPDLRGVRQGTRSAARGIGRRRKPMSAAQKKAVGARMKKYWAARRKAQGN